MNESIKKKFELSGGSIRIDEVTKDEWHYTEDLDVEKFADMIVRQCCFEIAHQSTLTNRKDVQDFAVDCVDRITKRFGVA